MPHEFLFEEMQNRSANAARMKGKSSLNGVVFSRLAVAEINAAVAATTGQRNVDFQTHEGRRRMAENMSGVEDDDAMWQRINRTLNAHIRYVGVAITGCKAGPGNALQRQGFSATRGGLMTVMNTGNKAVPAGARVAIEFHMRDILNHALKSRRLAALQLEGVPRSKLLPRLVQVRDEVDVQYDLGARSAVGTGPVYPINEPALAVPAIAHMLRREFGFQ